MPFVGMDRSMGEKLGASIGKVIMVDTNENEMGWDKYMRVKVVVDITKPLARSRFLNIGDKRLWISFKYERLPNFCFQCGIIKHFKRRCSLLKSDKGPDESKNFQ